MIDTDKNPGGKSSGRERRRHPRVQAGSPVTLNLAEGSFEARLRDISVAGLCFHIDRRIEEMTVLQVGFDLPLGGGESAVRGTGVVVRCEPISPRVDHYEVAVFFQSLEDASRELLARYIESQVAC